MKLIVYGSFNCPYSFVASRRLDRLVEIGVAEVEWRAVVHDPDVPPSALPISGHLADVLDRELEKFEVCCVATNRMCCRGRQRSPTRPGLSPGYAAAAGADVDVERLRRALFDAFWARCLDIGDGEALRQLGCRTATSTAVAERWRDEWLGFERPTAPMLVLPDGAQSRGLGAVKRLAGLIGGR